MYQALKIWGWIVQSLASNKQLKAVFCNGKRKATLGEPNATRPM